jgi:hypothetical protein
MGMKSRAYIRKLKSFLETEDLTNLSDEQLDKLDKFVSEHPDIDVLGELLIELGGKGSVGNFIVEHLHSILKQVVDAGVEDVSRLQEIINQTTARLESNNLTENDRRQLHDLLKEFANILRDKSMRNDRLRLVIIGGAFVTVILVAGGFMWYKYKIDCLKIDLAKITDGNALLPRGTTS